MIATIDYNDYRWCWEVCDFGNFYKQKRRFFFFWSAVKAVVSDHRAAHQIVLEKAAKRQATIDKLKSEKEHQEAEEKKETRLVLDGKLYFSIKRSERS